MIMATLATEIRKLSSTCFLRGESLILRRQARTIISDVEIDNEKRLRI